MFLAILSMPVRASGILYSTRAFCWHPMYMPLLILRSGDSFDEFYDRLQMSVTLFVSLRLTSHFLGVINPRF